MRKLQNILKDIFKSFRNGRKTSLKVKKMIEKENTVYELVNLKKKYFVTWCWNLREENKSKNRRMYKNPKKWITCDLARYTFEKHFEGISAKF